MKKVFLILDVLLEHKQLVKVESNDDYDDQKMSAGVK